MSDIAPIKRPLSGPDTGEPPTEPPDYYEQPVPYEREEPDSMDYDPRGVTLR